MAHYRVKGGKVVEKQHCDGHLGTEAVAAELDHETERAKYMVLRCPTCNRERGIRRISKGR